MTGAGDHMALAVCPNPWCRSGVKPMPFAMRDRTHRVICGCDFKGPARDTREEAITAWNTRTESGVIGPVADDVQAVRDLIIHRCERDKDWHSKGAAALRTVNRLAAQSGVIGEMRDMLRVLIAKLSWGAAAGGEEYDLARAILAKLDEERGS